MCLLLIVNQTIKAQGNTPEDFTIGKKVNVANNYNVGKINLNIPLYNVDVDGFSLSASLDYLQAIPIGEAPIVGTNWDANLFGKIVVDNNDLGLMHSPESIKTTDGFHSSSFNFCLIKDATNNISKKSILDNPANVGTYNPNTFYFDFLGHHGYFIYDNVGQFLVYSEDENFKISFNGNKCHDIYQPINVFPEIIMKDSKGNEYYFGGDYNTMDVYYSENKYEMHSFVDNSGATYFTDIKSNKRINYLSAFHLKKIKLFNGRIIEAVYKNSNKSILDPFTNGGYYYNSTYLYGLPEKSTLLNNNIYLGMDKTGAFSSVSSWSSMNSGGNSDSRTSIFHKLAILESIKISDMGTLKFSYSQINNTYTKPFLRKIDLISYDKTVKSIGFGYTTKSNRVFLESLINNADKYNFEYYDYTNTYNDYTNAGLIKKIIYPTKGWDEFEYESHDVSKITHTNGYLQDKEMTSPGQRIKKIKTVESEDIYSSASQTKIFTYKNDDNKSSGITSYSSTTSTGGGLDSFSTSSSFGSREYDENVKYSKVTEEIYNKEKTEYYFTDLITNPDSIAIKRFPSSSTGSGSSDNGVKISKKNERGKLYKTFKYDPYNVPIFQEFIDYTNFLTNANPVNDISSSCSSCKITDDKYYVRIFESTNSNGTKYGTYQYQPVLPYLPRKIKTIVWTWPTSYPDNQGNKFITDKYIKYNTSYLYWHPFPVETTEYIPYPVGFMTNLPVQSNGKNVNKIYYAHDLLRRNTSCITGNCPSNTDGVGGKYSEYKYMYENNLLKPVINIIQNDNDKYKLTETIYDKSFLTNNFLMIGKQRYSKLRSSFNFDTFESAEVYDGATYELYDNKGNLLQSKQDSYSLPTTVLYGYNQTLPIAEIIGAKYSQVMQAFQLDPDDNNSYLELDIVQKSNLDKDETSEQALIDALDSFRTKSALLGFKITTYTYDPLIGISSKTDSNGNRKITKYDDLNRVDKELDLNGRILKEYKYSSVLTKFYNDAKSVSLVKNDCPAGSGGSYVNYSVPANKYISYISKDDANQQAMDEINTIGQAYVNSQSTCFYNSCEITRPYYILQSDYISFQPDSPTHVNAIVSIAPPNLTNLNMSWSGGVVIGTLGAFCRPTTFTTLNNISDSGNRKWRVTINQWGDITLTLTSGTTPNGTSDRINLNFGYNK